MYIFGKERPGRGNSKCKASEQSEPEMDDTIKLDILRRVEKSDYFLKCGPFRLLPCLGYCK